MSRNGKKKLQKVETQACLSKLFKKLLNQEKLYTYVHAVPKSRQRK